MKKLLTSFCILFAISLNAQTTWYQVSTPTNKNLNSIDFPSTMVGYIAGDDSLLLKTIDGGVTWNEISTSGFNFLSNGYNFLELDFVTEDIGFMTIGPYTGTYKTIDGGSTWAQIADANFCYNQGLYFHDESNGFIGGSGCFTSEIIMKFSSGIPVPVTINSQSWNSLDMIVDFDLNQFSTYGLAASTGGRILRTIDSGDTWDSIPSGLPAGTTLSSVTIVNDTLAYVGYDNGGNGFGLLMTTDAGLTWAEDINSATFHYPIFHDVYTAPSGVVYTGGTSTTTNNGIIFESPTFGMWNYYNVDYPIHKMTAYNDSIVWGVGDNGYVVTNTDIGHLTISENSAKARLLLYPNPSNDHIQVKLDLIGNESSEYQIVDITGAIIQNGEMKNDEIINIETIPAGMYFFQLKNEEFNPIKFIVE